MNINVSVNTWQQRQNDALPLFSMESISKLRNKEYECIIDFRKPRVHEVAEWLLSDKSWTEVL